MEHFGVGQLPSIYYVPDFIDVAQEQTLINQIQSAPRTKWRELKGRRLQYWGGMVHEKGMIPEAVPKWLENVLQDIAAKINMYPAPLNHVLINEYLPGQGIMPHQDGPLYHPVVAILSLGSPTVMRFTPIRNSFPEPSTTNPFPVESALPRPTVYKPSDGSARRFEDTCDSSKDTCPSRSGGGAGDGENGARESESASPAVKDEEGEGDMRERSGEGRPRGQPTCSVALMPRSLLVFKDEAYTEYLHGIDESMEHALDHTLMNASALGARGCRIPDADLLSAVSAAGGTGSGNGVLSRDGTRLSLTCRRVLKVRKSLIRL